MAGVLVAELGFAAAAPAAAFLLAIHPLHVRYGADGRGYSFVVLLTLLGGWLLLRALRDGRWRWWLAYGASQFWLLWTFPLAVYVPLSFGLAGIAALAVDRERSAGDRALLAARFAVANVLAAMAFLQLMAPNLAQAAAFKKEWHDAGRLDLYWLQRFWVMMSSGLQVRGPRHLDVWFPTLANLGEARRRLNQLVGRERAQRVEWLMDYKHNKERYERQEIEAGVKQPEPEQMGRRSPPRRPRP